MSSVKHFIDLFIEAVCFGKTNETPKTYRSKLEYLRSWMDRQDLCLTKLTKTDIGNFQKHMIERSEKRRGSRIVAGPLSPFTIRSVMMTVKHFLLWAHRSKKTDQDLSSYLILPKPPAPDPKAIDQSTVLSLLKAASCTGDTWEQARNLALLYVLCDTGGRIGAIIKADIDNLDLKRGKLYVMEKGNKPHNLFLNPTTINSLREWLKHRSELKPKCRRLFLSYRSKGLARSSIYSLLNRIKRHAPQIQGRINPHSFRHAWARDALDAGEDLSKVAETLGHTTIRVTAEYYARWTDGELKKAHSKFSPGASLPIIKPKGDR